MGSTVQNAPLCSVELLVACFVVGQVHFNTKGARGVNFCSCLSHRLDTHQLSEDDVPTSVIIIYSSDTVTVKLKVKLNSHFVQLVKPEHTDFFFFFWLLG